MAKHSPDNIPYATDSAPSIPIGPDKPWLAPLAGYSDLPFRLLCREYGAACCVTEMVSAKGLFYGGNNTWKILSTSPRDTPLVVQLFGAEAPYLGHAVRLLKDHGFSWFDLNMGCSVPKVAKQGAGSAMMLDPDNALACAKAMIEAAEPGHVSFKLRLGVTAAKRNWMDLALRLEDAGAGLLTLHPRTAKEGFGGHSHWEALAETKIRLEIPVLASGDLFTAKDAMDCLGQTGVDGVMYARGALSNPAIFADHLALIQGEEPEQPTAEALKQMIRRHIELIGQFNPEDNTVFRLRSIVPRYVKGMPGVRQLRQALCVIKTLEEVEPIIDACLKDARPDEILPPPSTLPCPCDL